MEDSEKQQNIFLMCTSFTSVSYPAEWISCSASLDTADAESGASRSGAEDDSHLKKVTRVARLGSVFWRTGGAITAFTVSLIQKFHSGAASFV